MVSRVNETTLKLSFLTIKWLVFFSISLSANVLLATITDVNSPPFQPAATAHVLKMNFISPLPVSRQPAHHVINAGVEAPRETLIPANLVVQRAGEASVEKSTERSVPDVDKNSQLIEKNRLDTPQAQAASKNSKPDGKTLLGDSNERHHQLSSDIHKVSPVPVSQQQLSENAAVLEVSNLAEGSASDPRADVNTVLEGSRGLVSEEVYTAAQYLRRDPPRYPERARTLGQQGTVVLHAEVLPNGYSQQLKVAVSSGHQLLDGAAIAAVKKWQFAPAYAQGNPVAHWVSVPVRFTLQ